MSDASKQTEWIWVIDPGEEEWITRDEAEAEKQKAAGHEVEQYGAASEVPDAQAPLHSVSIKSKDGSPYSADIRIDGKQPETIQSLTVECGVGHQNRVTIVCEPEVLEIEGAFEGWVDAAEREPDKLQSLLEQIRDKDEETSDGAIGSLARQALDLIQVPTWPAPEVQRLLQEISAGRLAVPDITPQALTGALADWPGHAGGGPTRG